MRYTDAAKDAKSPILDHYTGVEKCWRAQPGHCIRPIAPGCTRKRGSLFSLDDAKNNDLISWDRRRENLTLLEIPSTTEFVFKK